MKVHTSSEKDSHETKRKTLTRREKFTKVFYATFLMQPNMSFSQMQNSIWVLLNSLELKFYHLALGISNLCLILKFFNSDYVSQIGLLLIKASLMRRCNLKCKNHKFKLFRISNFSLSYFSTHPIPMRVHFELQFSIKLWEKNYLNSLSPFYTKYQFCITQASCFAPSNI